MYNRKLNTHRNTTHFTKIHTILRISIKHIKAVPKKMLFPASMREVRIGNENTENKSKHNVKSSAWTNNALRVPINAHSVLKTRESVSVRPRTTRESTSYLKKDSEHSRQGRDRD